MHQMFVCFSSGCLFIWMKITRKQDHVSAICRIWRTGGGGCGCPPPPLPRFQILRPNLFAAAATPLCDAGKISLAPPPYTNPGSAPDVYYNPPSPSSSSSSSTMEVSQTPDPVHTRIYPPGAPRKLVLWVKFCTV